MKDLRVSHFSTMRIKLLRRPSSSILMMMMMTMIQDLPWARAASSRPIPLVGRIAVATAKDQSLVTTSSSRRCQRQGPRRTATTLRQRVRIWPHGTTRLQACVEGCGGGGAFWSSHNGTLGFDKATGARQMTTMQKRFLSGGPKKVLPGNTDVRGGADHSSQSSSSTSSSTTTSTTSTTTTTKDPTVYNTSYPLQRQIQRGAGGAILAVGFVLSATRALVTNGGQWKRLQPTVESFRQFLQKSEIDLELSKTLNYRLLDTLVILSRVQKQLWQGKDIRDCVTAGSWVLPNVPRAIPTMTEGLRYMKYATAAYGDSMILAADIDLKGQHDVWPGRLTKSRVSDHIGVPENDIVLMDIDYAGDTNHLRHFVAVDHANKKVVLAIRGTFSLSELVVDAASFSTPFCEGEAHSEMANMAEKVWGRVGNKLLELLDENEGYDLVLTGHSLGGGVACLMNILCQQNQCELVRGRRVKCFTYASPPVFTPLTSARAAVLSCTNYVHENDLVPFLSVDAVRHLFKSIAAIQARPECQTWFSRMRLVTGYRMPSEEFVGEIHQASTERLKAKPGAPCLAIPAATNVWMRAATNNPGNYDFKICDPWGMATLGIQIDLNMVQDHFPPRYEHALHNLEEQEK